MSIYGPSKKTPASGEALPRVSEYVRKSGARMPGRLNKGNKNITDLAQPTDPQDAATAKYVGDYAGLLNDRKLEKTGGTMTGDLAMSGNKITGLGDPIVSNDAATKGYTDRFISYLNDSKVNKRGDTMTGSLNMGQEKNYQSLRAYRKQRRRDKRVRGQIRARYKSARFGKIYGVE